MADLYVQSFDLALVRNRSLMGRIIRWATRSRGEEPTYANHVGVILNSGEMPTHWHAAAIVEAQKKVVHRPFRALEGRDMVIFRPLTLTQPQQRAIRNELLYHVGHGYAWWKLGVHLYAKLTGHKAPLKWVDTSGSDICSDLVAKAWKRAGLTFGVRAKFATPDDIFDYCVANPQKYERVFAGRMPRANSDTG